LLTKASAYLSPAFPMRLIYYAINNGRTSI
jgi:hypothetical protein